MAVAARNISEGGLLADMVAYSPDMDTELRQQLLETIDVPERLRKVGAFLAKQIEVLELKGRIQSEVKSEMDKTQREYILREQMKAIQKELGEDDPAVAEAGELRDAGRGVGDARRGEGEGAQGGGPHGPHPVRLARAGRHPHLRRLAGQPARGASTPTTTSTWPMPSRILNEDHYGLEKPKERIVEYMAVRKLADKIRSPILLFVGPPGVGKTSLGKSIARAMGRKFVRMSLGGIHDEAEIRGHRRTYIGALPGRVIQSIKTAGSANPVFMLDEIDKVGMDFRGDPSSALLEVLDPEQNNTLPGQLPGGAVRPLEGALHRHRQHARHRSRRPFATGWRSSSFPATPQHEKLRHRAALPRAQAARGARPDRRRARPRGAALVRLIQAFTKEAGVRNLEREIANVARKVAARSPTTAR